MGSPYERCVIGLRADHSMRAVVEGNFLEPDLDTAVSRYSASPEFSRILSALEPSLPGACVLDVGAGRGLTSLALARQGIRVVSVEHDPSHIVGLGALVTSGCLERVQLTPVRASVLELPFRDGCFEIVFCRSLLHHLSDLEGGMRELCRVLKPGGLFLACNEHILPPFSDGRLFLKAHPAVAYGVDERAYGTWTYWWRLKAAGFGRIRFFSDSHALGFSEFRKSTQEHPVRARLIGLPFVGAFFARVLHALHLALRHHLRHLLPPEQTLPAISMLARKGRARKRTPPAHED